MGEILKVINVAKSEVGYLEKKDKNYLNNPTKNAGSKNWTKYWADLKPSFQGEPWCLCFICWCFMKAFGEKRGKELLCMTKGWEFYTPTSANNFKLKNQWHTKPQRGDIVFFKNSSRICHVGIVTKVSDKYIWTIEGNTDKGSEVIPNGGGVAKKKYVIGNYRIAGFGRPAYKTTTKTTTTVKKEEEKVVDPKTFKAYRAEVNVNSLNGREKPSLLGKIIKILKKGEVYTIVEEKGTWGKSNTGIWMSTKYLKRI